jgi:hypothetical protein
MLIGDDPYPFCLDKPNLSIAKSCDQGAVRFLRPVTFSLTMDPTSPNQVNVPVSGNANSNATTPAPSSVNLPSSNQRLAAWGARYELKNPHVLNSQENRKAYFAGLTATGQLLANTTGKIYQAIASHKPDPNKSPTDYDAWQAEALAALSALPANISQDAFDAAFAKQLDALVEVMVKDDPNFLTDGRTAWLAYQNYFASRETALNSLNGANIATIEYTHNDPANQPSISNVRFIYSNQLSKSFLLTTNLTGEWYNSLPKGTTVGTFRDAQFSAEADISLKQWGQLGVPTLAAAGYYQYQRDPALINITNANLAPGTDITLPTGAATVLGQRGNIGIAQIKFTIPFKNTGVTFPVAVTWANRTELIKANDISGHIGIAFDLDGLFTQSSSGGGSK